MRRLLTTRAAAFALALGVVAPVQAEVRQAAPDALLLDFAHRVAAPAPAVYAALGRVGEWWSGAHTYSGDAGNLALRTEAGACFCERWTEGSVEHARVLLALKDRLLRLDGAFGPLQAKPVTAVLTIALKPEEGGTAIAVTYRVGGPAAAALDKDAAAVDRVLGEQFARLARFVDGAKP